MKVDEDIVDIETNSYGDSPLLLISSVSSIRAYSSKPRVTTSAPTYRPLLQLRTTRAGIFILFYYFQYFKFKLFFRDVVVSLVLLCLRTFPILGIALKCLGCSIPRSLRTTVNTTEHRVLSIFSPDKCTLN